MRLRSISTTRHLRGPGHHPSDTELIALVVPGSDSPTATDIVALAHVSQCRICTERSTSLQTFLDATATRAEADFERSVSAERLLAQRRRIVRRLRRSIEPSHTARVLQFPTIARPTLTRVHQAGRWLAVAAVAGVVVGVTAGQFLHWHPESQVESVQTEVVPARDQEATSPIMASTSLADDLFFTDDPFLAEVELMLTDPRIPELDPLDEITPRIREVAVSPW